MTDEPKTHKGEVMPLLKQPDGTMHGLYREGETVTPGMFVPVKEGEPLMPGRSLMSMKPREDSPILDAERFEVEGDGGRGIGHKGPARANSRAYNEGYDRIQWGSQTVGEA